MQNLTLQALLANFPHPTPRPLQLDAFNQIVATKGPGVILEMPTGGGKTAIYIAAARTIVQAGKGPVIIATPTKVQLDQIAAKFPNDVIVTSGRSDYECNLFAEKHGEPGTSAADSPCYMLDCPHRVNMDSGNVQDPSATPCNYYQAKWNAHVAIHRGKILLTTVAWLLTNRLLVKQWRTITPALTIIDEIHRLPQTVRSLFRRQITDYHIGKVAEALEPHAPDEATELHAFSRLLGEITRTHGSKTSQPGKKHLLKQEDLKKLITAARKIDTAKIKKATKAAIDSGALDPTHDRAELNTLESIVLGLHRIIRSMEYGTTEHTKHPTNFVIAYWYPDWYLDNTKKRAATTLVIHSYYVAGAINAVVGSQIFGASATLGNHRIFGHESGIKAPIVSIGSAFNADNTRLYLPSDAISLSHPSAATRKKRRNKALRRIITAALRFTTEGHRCLVIVQSETERAKFAEFAAASSLQVVTYDETQNAREATAAFKKGKGNVLLGTAAHLAEGFDAPGTIAPVTFFLRAGFPPKDAPQAQFEHRRFGKNGCWAIWQHRAAIQAIQARGRNVRTATDRGVTFFISAQFRSWLFNAIPKWLQSAYKGNLIMDTCIEDALTLLATRTGTPTSGAREAI